jgi:lysozyme family protein
MKYTPAIGAKYLSIWDGMKVTKRTEANKVADKILANKKRYQVVERLTGVPWYFVALTHYRESSLNFSKNLCNGQPLNMRTTIVPKGRGPYASFEDSAVDALVTIKKYSADLDWSFGPFCYRIEGYNGYGYWKKGIPSPYLWGGTNRQQVGKYVRDHIYDATVWDSQLGVLAILKCLMDKDATIVFKDFEKEAPPTLPVPEDDEEDIEEAPKGKVDGGALFRQISILLSTLVAFATDWRVMGVVIVGLLAGWAIWKASGKPRLW